jgi:hypothetical protein
MHMAIIIFCFIQSRKTDKGRMKRKQLLWFPFDFFDSYTIKNRRPAPSFLRHIIKIYLYERSDDSISACSLYDWQWRQWCAVYDGYISSGKWVNERKTKGLP